MLLKHLVPGLVALFMALPSNAVNFPRPDGLEPDIHFWMQIFTEVPSQQILVHDNRRLDIIYARLDLPNKGNVRSKRNFRKKVQQQYKSILKTLARGKREGLTSEEAQVLALWPEDVDNSELRAAADRVRVQQGLADGFRDGLVRAARWEEYILDSLRAAGVPAELAALPHIESSYNPNARSHVGAAGLWQFTRPTGRRFMQIDHVVDERRDPYKSSKAAAALLQYNYSILKSWPLAITAYNHGVSGMRRAVRVTGTDDIEIIVRHYKGRSFGFASRNFYVAFLAAQDVVRNSQVYFGQIVKDQPDDTVTVILSDYMSAASLGDAFGISRRTLQKNNPALLDSVWTGLKYVPKGFELRLPSGELSASAEKLMAAIPLEQRFRHQTPDLEHKVRWGDSLSSIAVRYKTTVANLMAVNNLKSRHQIRAGQTLNLPYKGKGIQTVIASGTTTYTVQSGDTLGQISRRSGVPVRALLARNGLADRNQIHAGQKLFLNVADTTGKGVPPSSESPAIAKLPAAQQQPDLITGEVLAEKTVSDEATIVSVDVPAESEPDTAMKADPSDYFVTADGTIEIQAEETLGHYASWLNVRTQKLRDLNNYAFRKPVVIGRRLRLDFTRVTAEQFKAKRIAYHRELQETFFTRYRIADTKVHEFRRGDSFFVLSLRRYKVPVWLLRQYNPELNPDRIKPGTQIIIPQIERVDGEVGIQDTVADA
ncbi:MAG TPA: LysM peptidoglycan-binding domain-containing protein [Gammaproteobacteria bacterium]|jgi:membrane-bound lytic murein transglycosylase D|nr:lytic transglycosylase [Chromatiales bacterium]MDP7660062.1 LysM peptidoglycan-binding domain-containing protein [Gammaproteobacteria bacterium]HJP37502.1 LysM peptidoglycan-binding domain-containing protein [Gammaproteobacteria bacterium]